MPAVDVAVVGAGPAGTSTAIHLARAGRRVVVLDKATFPRDKCCGDGLTAGALRTLERLGLDPSDVPSWQPVDDVVVRSPSGREVVFPLPRGQGAFAAVARRTDLDAALVALARDAGATVLEGCPLDDVRVDADRIVLNGDLATSHVVGADGMWSPLRKALGADEPGYLGEWHAFRQYFTGVADRAARELVVWFEPDLLPGYAWSFPLPGGVANVGFGIQRDGAPTKAMKAMWPDLLDRPHIRSFLGADAVPESPHKAWPSPARVGRLPLTAAGGRVLFAGDAAAVTDPMTGEGIGQALLTGRLAGEAIAAALDAPSEVVARYERDVAHHLFADHRMSRRLGRVLAHPRGARGAIRVVAGSGAWGRRNFARWMFEDEPRAIVTTPRRWHRRFLKQPGAYR